MDVSIIIVNWNVRDLLVKCLESVFRRTKDIDFEVIVVDNASNDNSVTEIRKAFSSEILNNKLLIIANRHNNGFAKANNQGLREAKGKYVLFMNPDMEFIDNTIHKMIGVIEAEDNIGACACQLLYGDRTLQPNVKNDPTFFSQLLIELKLHHIIKTRSLKKYLAKDFDYTKTSSVQQIMGAFVFTKKSIMKELNGWDEDYWLWWEDLDLCKRIRMKNYKIVYSPVSQVVHYEGKSFAQQMSVPKQKRFVRGLLTYFKKHHSKLAYYILLIFSPISIFLAYLSQILKIKPKTQSKI